MSTAKTKDSIGARLKRAGKRPVHALSAKEYHSIVGADNAALRRSAFSAPRLRQFKVQYQRTGVSAGVACERVVRERVVREEWPLQPGGYTSYTRIVYAHSHLDAWVRVVSLVAAEMGEAAFYCCYIEEVR